MLTLTNKEFNELIVYPFTGKNWFVLIGLQGAVLMLLCPFLIGIPLINGFMIAHIQSGINGTKNYPEWDFQLYWKLGWKALVAGLVYGLPMICFLLLYAVILVLGTLLTALINDDAILIMFMIVSSLSSVLFYLVFIMYALFNAVVQVATSTKIAAGGSIAEAINLKKFVWPFLKANIFNVVIIFLIGYFASLVSGLGAVAFFIGMFFTMPFAFALIGYGYGIVYRLSPVK
ncbi:MAG: DUF4013 domain-containing protein [Patescibacteria group bacterium]